MLKYKLHVETIQKDFSTALSKLLKNGWHETIIALLYNVECFLKTLIGMCFPNWTCISRRGVSTILSHFLNWIMNRRFPWKSDILHGIVLVWRLLILNSSEYRKPCRQYLCMCYEFESYTIETFQPPKETYFLLHSYDQEPGIMLL